MALGRWQATIQDQAGNVIPNAQVTVRREISGAPLALLYSDRAGSVPISNPVMADTNGFAFFHATGGAYRLDASDASGTVMTWRYVPVGLSAEGDAPVIDISYAFDATSNADSDPGAGNLRFNNASLGSVTQLFFDNLDDFGADVTAWLDRLDDFGSASDRGAIIVRAVDGSAELIGRVTGSVTNGGGYRKVSVTVLSSVGTFATGRVSVSFQSTGTPGADGAGNVSVTGITLAAGNVPTFGNDAGTQLANSGSKLVGRQTVWIPAGAFVPFAATAPESTVVRLTNMAYSVLRFDASSVETAFATIKMPKGWDEGTVQAQALWFAETAAAGDVIWQIGGGSFSHLSMINQDVSGSLQSLTSSAPADGAVLVMTADSAAISLTDNSPPIQEGDMVTVMVRRNASSGSDTLATDADLLGVALYYNTVKNTDD